MCSEKCQIVSDCALDPLGLHIGITMLPRGQRRLLPFARVSIRCGGEKLPHQRFTKPPYHRHVVFLNQQQDDKRPLAFPSSERSKPHGRNPIALANTALPLRPCVKSSCASRAAAHSWRSRSSPQLGADRCKPLPPQERLPGARACASVI